ncbi:hypothetical protein GH740_05480 [Microbacterium sp. SYP-A9085]|uniref:ABC transporter substrate-binding protein n=1 Tax=Microbacterium sp. SYP-A9085 TaxID=2664454 RepID=UPI00129BE846|nr:hypothetical protein [Microbacterium sp. SYP-A9085]MRH28765.1 hypothetical protein [Microbacterium sp. SYP-A9085]
MSRRRFTSLRRAVAALAAATLAVTAVGCSSSNPEGEPSASQEERTITIGYSARAPFVLPALLAESGMDQFAGRGLKFKGQLVSAPDALPLLATGKLDVFMGPVSAGIFNAIGSGSKLQIVAPGGTSSNPSNWYISKAALKGKEYSIDAWRGEKVYTSTGAGSYVMISLAHILEPAGMTPKDLQFAQIPPDDVGPALTSGAIFAGIPASIKVRQQLLKDGDVIEGPSAVWPQGISPGFLFFGKSLLEDEPALAQKVLDGFADLYANYLQDGYQTDKDKAAVIAKVLDYQPDTLPTLVKEVYPADLSFPDGWAKNAESVWRTLSNVLSYDGSIADKVVATDLIRKALQKG